MRRQAGTRRRAAAARLSVQLRPAGARAERAPTLACLLPSTSCRATRRPGLPRELLRPRGGPWHELPRRYAQLPEHDGRRADSALTWHAMHGTSDGAFRQQCDLVPLCQVRAGVGCNGRNSISSEDAPYRGGAGRSPPQNPRPIAGLPYLTAFNNVNVNIIGYPARTGPGESWYWVSRELEARSLSRSSTAGDRGLPIASTTTT